MKIGVLDFVNGERKGDQEKQQPSVQGKEPQTNSTSVRCQGYGSGIKPGSSRLKQHPDRFTWWNKLIIQFFSHEDTSPNQFWFPSHTELYKLSCTEILGTSSYSLYELTSSFHIFHLSHLSGTLFSTFLLRFRVVTSAEVAASKTSSGMLTAFLLLHKEKKIYSWFGAM